MESLYVCQFSNGHIKVGRSIDPESRMATHAERVACLGVDLSDRFTAACVGPASHAEAWLIDRCAEAASQRFQNEWFAGLDFLLVCEWASKAASEATELSAHRVDGFGWRLREARRAAGLTQAQLGVGMGTSGADLLKAAVSTWEVDRNFPNVNQIRLICQRLGVSADHLLGLVKKAA